ncbi:hypothetical protein LIER_39811 [Lithospermum erythrorhizon]|uniref:PWWP domain-containing protein n=1 Tax=Lithospermum erythrorhizon TaxID=34254 RepID=A0AAV3QN60_LITER
MTSNQETEAPKNNNTLNENEVSVVGSLDHGNARDENLGGMDMLGLVCSEEYNKIDEKKGDTSVVVNQETIDGDRANVDPRRIDEFLVGDLVWGKIKNHPSWPGLIYDPSDGSDIAKKSKKVNKILVAYFGDGTYNWCSKSQLVPFVDHYEKMSKQSNSVNFVYAVEEALEELGRRIERTMICSCVPEENLSGLARPEAINAGVRPGVLLPDGAIGNLPSIWCEPAKLLEYVRNVKQTFPVSNLLQLILMKTMLSAFSRVRRGCCLPIYREAKLIEGLEDKSEIAVPDTNDFSVPIKVPIECSSEEESSGSPKVLPMKGLMLTSTQKRKQKSVAEIMGEGTTKKSKITEETHSITEKSKKTASNDDINKSGILQASTAKRMRHSKKILVENERSRSIERKQDEDTGHDDNANGTRQSSAAGRKRAKKKKDSLVSCSVVSNEDVHLERVENESIPSIELRKNEDPDDDVETSNYKLHNDQISEKKWKPSVSEKGDIGSDLNNVDVVPAQQATDSENTDKPRSRVTKLKKDARAAGTNKTDVDITAPDVSQVDVLRQNIVDLKSMLNQCDGNISPEEKSSLEGEIRSMLQKVGELAVKASSSSS